MAKLKVVNLEGADVGEIDVADAVFGADVKEHLLWEAVRWQRAKRRAGTAKVKERNEITSRTKAKMYKQKGTGGARHGNARANIFVGGGQVHGPRPRSYAFHMNKKALAGALRSALSLRAKENALVVVRDFAVESSKTKNLAKALGKLSAEKALLVDDGGNDSLRLSSRNLPTALFIEPRGLNVYDVLRFPKLLISESSIRELEKRLDKVSEKGAVA
jgi:large subunit ribosomal protein L4